MKTKNFLSVLLCMALFATACVVFTSCGDDGNDPSSSWYDDGGSNSGGNNGGSSGGSGSGGSNGGSDDGGSNGGSGNGGNNGGNDGGGKTDVAPAAPTGVTAQTQGPKKYPWVEVKWNYDSSVDHWDVYRSTKESSGYSKIGSNITYSYGDENVKYNTTYYYKVKAVSKGGKASDFSESAAAYVEYYSE